MTCRQLKLKISSICNSPDEEVTNKFEEVEAARDCLMDAMLQCAKSMPGNPELKIMRLGDVGLDDSKLDSIVKGIVNKLVGKDSWEDAVDDLHAENERLKDEIGALSLRLMEYDGMQPRDAGADAAAAGAQADDVDGDPSDEASEDERGSGQESEEASDDLGDPRHSATPAQRKVSKPTAPAQTQGLAKCRVDSCENYVDGDSSWSLPRRLCRDHTVSYGRCNVLARESGKAFSMQKFENWAASGSNNMVRCLLKGANSV